LNDEEGAGPDVWGKLLPDRFCRQTDNSWDTSDGTANSPNLPEFSPIAIDDYERE
jgi:hypothetical protein